MAERGVPVEPSGSGTCISFFDSDDISSCNRKKRLQAEVNKNRTSVKVNHVTRLTLRSFALVD